MFRRKTRTYVLNQKLRTGNRFVVGRVLVAVFLIAVVTLQYATRSDNESVVSTTRPIATKAYTVPVDNQHQEIMSAIEWPTYGQAAYGVVDSDVVASSDEASESVPIASLAKVITALAVLEKQPLSIGEQGPMITTTEQDVAIYRDYVAKNGTVVPVALGVEISQYQALQAMLLPSANNISDMLVNWAFGSADAYVVYANQMLRELGFTDTIVADASGYSSQTKSTAEEMVEIGMLYVENELLREIATQQDVAFPFAGQIENKNNKIDEDGTLGIKVGFTYEANRTFLVANFHGESEDEISVVAVLGADSWPTVAQDAKAILASGNNAHIEIKNIP